MMDLERRQEVEKGKFWIAAGADAYGKLTEKQRLALEALISERSIQKASDAGGVSVRTIYKWLDSAHPFGFVYDAVNRARYRHLFSLLQVVGEKAVLRLEELLDDDELSPRDLNVAIRTALDAAFKAQNSDVADILRAYQQALEQAEEQNSG